MEAWHAAKVALQGLIEREQDVALLGMKWQ
jgi:hypothetical protein